MKHAILVAALLALAASAVRAGEPGTDSMTVDDAVRRALDRHPLVQQAAEAVNAAQARIELSRAGYLPSLEGRLGYTRIGPVPTIEFAPMGELKLYPENNWDQHFALGQTIYDFGKTGAAVGVGRADAAVAADNVAVVRSSLAFQTIQSFWAMLFLRRSIDVQDMRIAALTDHMRTTEKQSKAGLATDFDVLTTKVRIASAQNGKADLENELRKVEASFRQLVDLPAGSDIRIRGEFEAVPVGLDVDSLVAVALERRNEIKMSSDGEHAAKLRETLASKRDMPVVRANLQYGVKNGYQPDLDEQRENWVVGLQAVVPLFDGFQARNAEREAQANSRAAEARTRDARRLVTTQVQQAISDVQAAIDKMHTSAVQVEQAEQAVSLANVRYESGVVTNLDVIDAEAALAEARLARLLALYRYVVSRAGLEYATGGELVRQ